MVDAKRLFYIRRCCCCCCCWVLSFPCSFLVISIGQTIWNHLSTAIWLFGIFYWFQVCIFFPSFSIQCITFHYYSLVLNHSEQRHKVSLSLSTPNPQLWNTIEKQNKREREITFFFISLCMCVSLLPTDGYKSFIHWGSDERTQKIHIYSLATTWICMCVYWPETHASTHFEMK